MSDTVTVSVSQGGLKGRKVSSKAGGVYYSFQGIPYAKPPVGPLRFKAPVAPEPWEGVREALAEGSVCPHIQNIIDEGYKGDEDCLFLNVYTPKVPTSEGSNPKLAVMVWIHGGGFNNGCGNIEFYGPDFILAEDTILVTINYRLGALGFLSLGTAEAPGNAGMKDQVMALKWVQQNIAKFGGDPKNVTIFGESAGAASVHYHMLSPMSKGLFHRAIAQSGSALNPWAFYKPETARRKAFRFGEALGCTTSDPKVLAEFLREVPARQLVEDLPKAMTEEERDMGSVYFRPTVEQGAGEAFLTQTPLEIVKAGTFHQVPFLTGVNTSEGLFSLKEVIAKPSLLKLYDSHFEVLVPEDLKGDRKDLAQKIKSFYFGDKPVSQETLMQYVDLSSDTWFVNGIYKTVKLQVERSTSPVYLYMFAFDGQLGFMKRVVGADRFPGVCHADELGYLFYSPHLDAQLDPASPEVKTRSTFVKLLTNFAKTGNPSLSMLNWPPVSKTDFVYLNIDKKMSISHEFLKDRMSFWENLQ